MNIVASFLLTNYEYPFWKYAEKPNPVTYTEKWRNSVQKTGVEAIVFTDEEQPELSALGVNIGTVIGSVEWTNQIDCRWLIAYEFLKLNKGIEYFFMTDISDVTLLKNPFDFVEKGKVYVGDETVKVFNEWIMSRVDLIGENECRENILALRDKPLLNCGIFGGHRDTIMPVMEDICKKLEDYQVTEDTIDMVVMNEVLHSKYSDIIVHGSPLNTDFWKWDFDNKECYFQHK